MAKEERSTSNIDWPAFLVELSEKLLNDADEIDLDALDDPARATSRWLGFPGAAEADIAARETDLALRLPDDYRAFLLASDGFVGLAGLPHGLCRLLPVHEIGWMREKDENVGRLAEYVRGREKGADMPDDFIVDPVDFERTILIGDFDGNECVLLLPPRDDGTWELWTYDPENGFETGLTFTELMESANEA